MSKFKSGNKVIVLHSPTGDEDLYAAGHVGVYSGDGWVDFKNQGNTFVNDDGFCNVLEKNMKLYKEPESFLVWQHTSEYMNEEQKEALRALLRRVQWDAAYASYINFVDANDISTLMDWPATDEGFDFWEDVYNQVLRGAHPHNTDDPIVSKTAGGVVDEVAHKSALATQEGGVHYKKCGIQPVEYIQANGLDYFQGNVIKYTTRHKDKGGEEDIKKAIHYLQLILELQYKK